MPFTDSMFCEKCFKSPRETKGLILHRVNPVGVKGIWRCQHCLTPEQKAKINPEVDEITKIIAKGK